MEEYGNNDVDRKQMQAVDRKQEIYLEWPIRGYHIICNGVLGQILLTKGVLATQRGRDCQACHSSEFEETLWLTLWQDSRAPTKKNFEIM